MKRGLLIDMDEVIYSGEKMIPGADPFIHPLQDEQIPFLFMTNNSKRSSLDTVNKPARIGIKVEEENVCAGALAMAYFLTFMHPGSTIILTLIGGTKKVELNDYAFKPELIVDSVADLDIHKAMELGSPEKY